MATALQRRIRRLRIARGLTVDELARRASCSSSAVYKIETGRMLRGRPGRDGRPCGVGVMVFLSLALGVTLDELLSGEPGGRIRPFGRGRSRAPGPAR